MRPVNERGGSKEGVWALLRTQNLESGRVSQSFDGTLETVQSAKGKMSYFEWGSTGLRAMNRSKFLASVLATRAFWLVF